MSLVSQIRQWIGFFFSRRIPLRTLAGLSRRVSTSIGAGVDLRTVWSGEAARARNPVLKRRLETISAAVQEGESLSRGFAAAGDYFPPLLHELVEIGEQTGNLGEVFQQLAEHYESQLQMRRSFMTSIAGPMAQLGLAVAIIGFLIWIMGVLGPAPRGRGNPLGIPLVGNVGLAVYAGFIATVAAALFVIVHSVRRGLLWTRSIQRLWLKLPVVGTAFETLALARLTWALHLTLNTSMELKRALSVSLRSTGNARFCDRGPVILREIEQGNSLHEAFQEAGVFPQDFLDTIAVGEQGGRLVESMRLVSQQYHERARLALGTLTRVAGFLVWCIVAIIIVVLIFRMFSYYLNILNNPFGG